MLLPGVHISTFECFLCTSPDKKKVPIWIHSTDSNKEVMVLDAVRSIKAAFPEVHITGGLSNISYGLPQRKIINRTFVSLMMDAGMDSAIIDPLDQKIMATIRTADMLLSHDDFCMNYLKGVRAGSILS